MTPLIAVNCCSGLSSGTVIDKRTTGLVDNPLMIGKEGEVVVALTGELGGSTAFFLQPKLWTVSKRKIPI